MQLLEPSDNAGILPISYFHALARLGQEGLVLIEPKTPFISLGAFDDVATVLDSEYCRRRGLAVMRRETGGGMVLLGPGQVFYTLVLKRPHPGVPGRVDDAYAYLSAAPIATYHHFGIAARLRPINDIVTPEGRKIAGQGAGDINGHFCFVGSILIDFDTDLMHRIVKLPDESLRPPLKIALETHLTSIGRERGVRPSTETVKQALARAFAPLVGRLVPSEPSDRLLAETRNVATELQSEEALHGEERPPRRLFKVREGLYLCHRLLVVQNKTLLITLTIRDDIIEAATARETTGAAGELSLDGLVGKPFQRDAIRAGLPDLTGLDLRADEITTLILASRR